MFQEFIEIFILSAVQGISEFLPISSSAHLILVSKFYELKTASLIIDISLHLGSLLAIIFYFRKDLISIKNDKNIVIKKANKVFTLTSDIKYIPNTSESKIIVVPRSG